MVGVGEGADGLHASVAEGGVVGMFSVAVGDGLYSVAAGLGDEAESPVDAVLEGFVEGSYAMGSCELLQGLFGEDSCAIERSAVEHGFVESSELFDGASTIS